MSEAVQKANDLRARILQGYEPTEQEMHEIIELLIVDRTAMLAVSTSKPKKASSTKVDLADLL
jgi:hypothetical protein